MLIVDMPMPKHGCCDCMVELMGLCVIQDKDVPLKNENGDYPTELPKGCPIKGELPDEHGDLVDRDALLSVKDKYGKDVLCVSKNTIANMPALIAAERKDDEQIH